MTASGDAFDRFERLFKRLAAHYRCWYLDADDLAQVARIAAWLSLDRTSEPRFDPAKGSMSRWVTYAAMAATRAYADKQRKHLPLFRAADIDEIVEDDVRLCDTIPADMLPIDLLVLVTEIMAQLHPTYLPPLIAAAEDVTVHELADEVGVSHQAISQALLRAQRAAVRVANGLKPRKPGVGVFTGDAFRT